jgi:hypothetical protein
MPACIAAALLARVLLFGMRHGRHDRERHGGKQRCLQAGHLHLSSAKDARPRHEASYEPAGVILG